MEEKKTVTMELTAKEVDVINHIRKADEMSAYRRKVVLFVLSTAIDYQQWLFNNGRGSSFSTFVDEYLKGEVKSGTVLDDLVKAEHLGDLYNDVCVILERTSEFAGYTSKDVERFKE